MKTQKKILIDNVYANLEEMGIDITRIKGDRAYRIQDAQEVLKYEQDRVRCPFCDRLYLLDEICRHVECNHHADINH